MTKNYLSDYVLLTVHYGDDLYLPSEMAHDLFRRFATECGHPEWAEGEDWDVDFVHLEKVAEDEHMGLYRVCGNDDHIWLEPEENGTYTPRSAWMDRNPVVDELVFDVKQAADLDDLAQALKTLANAEPGIRYVAMERIDFSSLPTFHDHAPADTKGVWSWDARRVLVGDTIPFEIKLREDRYWYAAQRDNEDGARDNGSYDYAEAVEMAKSFGPESRIEVLEDGPDPVRVAVIEHDDLGNPWR